ncbi:lys-63-specific deubiquitinase BRCC36-like [Cotesia glomerata]|uniref:BRCA1 BRCA2-containing complex, subunit 3 n=1 Tax=Cotesia glomerata TaxID=32391 RepID=A0AAV7HSY2_COTGL|nr:lys-63-specific deubiquitinase BRCC36-like [Cotesia glomerata]KAH0534233.1 BRCA1 BRCA2-containing complex, subunit 3 [Cotesia glomerata]
MEYPLKKVELQADVYMACLQHALSTENFEVMGLLIGDIDDGVTKISALNILLRLDKKKDRVEISPEQLLKAAAEAERLTIELKRDMRVIGWYHSHPHITVFPSHVDIGTQATYQLMDPCFVGLIFSVFSEKKETKEQECVLTCFQSRNNEAVEIPLEIVKVGEISKECMDALKDLPKILVLEDDEVGDNCINNSDPLAIIHNKAVRTRALAHITDIVTKPLIEMLEERLILNENYKAHLHKVKQKLLKELEKSRPTRPETESTKKRNKKFRGKK